MRDGDDTIPSLHMIDGVPMFVVQPGERKENVMDILDCGKCVLQHFLPCGKPEHFDAHRIAMRHYLSRDVPVVYAGFVGDPQARLWAQCYATPIGPIPVADVPVCV